MNPQGSEAAPAAASDGAGRAAPPRRDQRWIFWLVLAVCIAPFAGSLALYHFAPPDSRMNYGDLIEPLPLPQEPLVTLDGSSPTIAGLRGKWMFVVVADARCDKTCRDSLWKVRQVRLTRGQDMDRIERLWLLSGDGQPDPALLAEHAGLITARATPALLRALPTTVPGATDHIWLVDPLGNVMLRFPPGADPNLMKKDLARLLRVSRIG